MPSLRRVVRCIPCSIIFLAACASAGERRAVEEPAAKPGLVVESARVSSPTAQIELSRRPAWRTFQARYGDWKVLWNEDTGTPHRAFGNSIPLRSFANDPAAVEHAVRAFIAQNPAVFQAPTLETAAVYREGDVWYVRFQQTLRGLPVLNSDWEFRVGTNGRLMMFGADARTVSAGFDATPRVVGAVAREAGHLGLAFNAATDRTQGADRLYLLPVRGPDGSAQLRPVYRVEVVTRRPVGSWQSWVDAQTGEVLQRRSLMDHAISGQVTATVHLKLPTDAVTTKPLADAWVNVGTVLDTTDTSGNYSANPPTSPVCVTSRFSGPYCSIFRQDAADASFSRCGVANPSSGVNIVWNSTNSDDAERDCFYHVNLAHDHIKAIDPSYVASDYSLSVFVNYLDGTDCEAYWDQPSNSLNFWPSVTDGTCPSTGTMPDIIWHEYCHSVTYNLYFSHGAALGCQNATLREGMADAFSALMDDDPIIGNGWSGVGTYLRDISIDRRWPDDLTSDPEQSGAIFAGALWDVRQAIGRSKTDSLYHFAKYGLPDDGDDGIAMNEFFVDMLVTDDNNGNLGDGTPHMSQIVTAFNNHGIGTNFFIQATHAPQDDQISVGPFPITATIQYNGPFGSLSLAELFYSFNGGAYAEQPMLPTGNPDEYGAEIPRLAFGIVSYYLLMQDSFGGTTVLPSGAPARSAYQFVVGPTSVLLYYDMETNPGWTVGA